MKLQSGFSHKYKNKLLTYLLLVLVYFFSIVLILSFRLSLDLPKGLFPVVLPVIILKAHLPSSMVFT
jgi:hypothetical protein